MATAQSVEPRARRASPTGGQCVSYAFFKVDAAFRRLAAREQTDLKLELIRTIREFQRRMLVQPYSLVGLRADVALFNLDGHVYALDNRCPHARGPLYEGHVGRGERGPTLTCPWHQATFDLTSGAAIDGPTRTPARVHAVRVGPDGVIYVAEQAAPAASAG
jgi:nitrite reductase/ring-hydroxylating ferredoxin subunit